VAANGLVEFVKDRARSKLILVRAERPLHVRCRDPLIERTFANDGYQGRKMATTIAVTACWTIDIVRHCGLHRFVALPERRIVERCFAWVSRDRRLTRDFERCARTVAAFVGLAMIRIMFKSLTRPCGRIPSSIA
jgi:transposase